MIAVFSRYAEMETVFIYGSRAKGNFCLGSDIDLSLRREIEDPDLLNHIRLLGTPLYRRPEPCKTTY